MEMQNVNLHDSLSIIHLQEIAFSYIHIQFVVIECDLNLFSTSFNYIACIIMCCNHYICSCAINLELQSYNNL